jgi:hypothetical protein
MSACPFSICVNLRSSADSTGKTIPRGRLPYATLLLIVPIYPRGAAISQDLHGLPGALGVGFHKNELAIVNEIYGVGLDRVGRQVMISKMGLKGLNNGVLGVPRPLRRQIGFGIAPKDRRSGARRKDRADVARLFRYDGLIVNSFFKSRASQSLDGSFQVRCVVEYPYDGRHSQTAFCYICGSGESGTGRQSWQEVFCISKKNTPLRLRWINRNSVGRLKIRTSDQELYRVIFALPSIGADLKSSIVVG